MFLLGDFNTDLLQYESHSYTSEFLNTMISNSFLLYIHQPIRVTDHSETVIDNTFSNISDCETASGNTSSLIADHFAQFLLIKKCYVSRKLCDYHAYDYSNDDPSVSVTHHFNYFLENTTTTTTCIDSHLPKKKSLKETLN